MPRLSEADRIRIQTLHETGRSISHLARSFKASRKTIRRWISRLPNVVSDKKGRGRKEKKSLREIRAIHRSIQQSGNSLRKVAREHGVHHSTVAKYISNSHQSLYPYKVRVEPLLTNKNKQKRLNFVININILIVPNGLSLTRNHFNCSIHPTSKINDLGDQKRRNTVDTFMSVKSPRKIHMFTAINIKGKSKIRWYLEEKDTDEKISM